MTGVMVHGSYRLAEWVLWTSGIIGVLGAAALGSVASAFAHGGLSADEGVVNVDVRLAAFTLPPLVHALSIAAAIGLGRGREWSLPLARGVALALVAGPIVAVGSSSSVAWVIATDWLPLYLGQQLFGLSFMPLPLIHAALGVVALYGLRSRRAPIQAATPRGARPGRVARAAAIVAGLGVLQAGLIVAGAGRLAMTGELPSHGAAPLLGTVVVSAIAVIAARGIWSQRRWVIPAAPVTVLGLAGWTYVLSMLVLGLSRSEAVDGPDPVVLIISWAIPVVLGALALYALVALYRARLGFVTP